MSHTEVVFVTNSPRTSKLAVSRARPLMTTLGGPSRASRPSPALERPGFRDEKHCPDQNGHAQRDFHYEDPLPAKGGGQPTAK